MNERIEKLVKQIKKAKEQHKYFREHDFRYEESEASEIAKHLLLCGYAKADDFELCAIYHGHGYTSEHDPSDPHENGCGGGCPIQAICNECKGLKLALKRSNIKEIAEDSDDLPF